MIRFHKLFFLISTVVVFFFLTSVVLKKREPNIYQFPELSFFPKMPLNIENPLTYEGVDLGRHLFYDTILSLNFDMSCNSCHKQEFAFADAGQRFSKGSNGILTSRNSMPLFNLAWYSAFFWDGRASSIEAQVFHPVSDSNEMNLSWSLAEKRINKSSFYRKKFQLAFGKQNIDSVLISKAIGQFLRSLISYQSKFDRVLAGKDYLSPDEFAGFVLMNDMTKGDCMHCHTTDSNPLGTTGLFSNNGLDKFEHPLQFLDYGLGGYTKNLRDNGKFKIPSLRNVALTAPYMHDGRFNTLEEVLDFYSEGVQMSANIDPKMGSAHKGGVRLTDIEKRQIIAFLHTLTDHEFLQDPSFSNPFKK